MRVLHTSDWHLGRNLEGRSRIQEQREVIDEIVNIAEKEEVHMVLIAGDIFDTYNPPAEAEELFYRSVERLAANGKRAVVVIAGNHDSPDRILAADPLARKHGIFLLGYPGDNLYKAGLTENNYPEEGNEVAASVDYSFVPTDIPRVINGGPGWAEIAIPGCSENAVVVAVPYPSEQRLNEIISDSLEDKEMQKAYSERVSAAFRLGAANYRKDTVNLAVSHIFVLGGRSSESEREIQLGGAYIVEPSGLPVEADYVALGHLHRPQAVGGTPVLGRYSGSPLCYSFSESDQQKEVAVVEIKPGAKPLVKQVKLCAGKAMRQVRFNSYEEAVEWCGQENNHNLWVDMEIGAAEPLQGSMISHLRKIHPGVINIRVLLPGIEIHEESTERIANLSLEEKFRRFVVRETGVEPTKELTEMLAELLAGGDFNEAN